MVPLDRLRPAISAMILRDHPDLAADALIRRTEANRYRIAYVEELIRSERGELSDLERQVTRSLVEGELVSRNVEAEADARRSFGERVSDGLAAFGGSWRFLGAFAGFLAIWILFNAALSGSGGFDPYPFILLNLLLSCLAAIQAPVIMMSQRRQEEKDRLRSLNDYRINLKAELEIRHLHEKIDHLISKQWERLAEIQRLQIEMMQEGR
ncbi:DUF1003 domain-containing protein [Methylobrevis pamukkalensis]|uniref:DUF1003 domain-containing protein n=1 Tax=Methylobrevis pamukkalensis TaxID=1439726 RepID=UPI0008461E13